MSSPIEVVTCAAILAGGKSSRMGREKALINYDGQPLIQRVAETLKPIFPNICVVTFNPEVSKAAGCEAIADQYPDRGPFGGIHAALTHFQAPTFVVACDMPFLNGELIAYMAGNFSGDVLAPYSNDGVESLHAIYAPRCAAIFESFLKGEGEKMPSMRRSLRELDTRFVEVDMARKFDSTLRCFSNWNTPEDIEGAQRGA